MSGKYDDQPPELRAVLERADATVAYLRGRVTLSPQEVADLGSARDVHRSFEISLLQLRVDRLEDAVLALRAVQPPAGDAPPTSQG